MRRTRRIVHGLALCGLVAGSMGGCNDEINMARQPRAGTLQPSSLFREGGAARPFVEGVVSTNGVCFTSAADTSTSAPPKLTSELLARGQMLFGISCVPCHGAAGLGDGMVVRRGYPRPPSYHTQRLRTVSDAYLYLVITRGLGKMPAYDDQVPRVDDRWALVAYVRALQLSQHAAVGDVPEGPRAALQHAPATAAPAATSRPPEVRP